MYKFIKNLQYERCFSCRKIDIFYNKSFTKDFYKGGFTQITMLRKYNTETIMIRKPLPRF